MLIAVLKRLVRCLIVMGSRCLRCLMFMLSGSVVVFFSVFYGLCYFRCGD